MSISGTAPGNGRRRPAPHPGPMIAHDHLEPLQVDARSLAAAIGMDAERLEAMLAGRESIDVETAVRLSRALQLNAEALMGLQLRHDFARAREDCALQSIPVLRDEGRLTFPPDGYLSGRLAGLRGFGNQDVRFETLGFFADGRSGVDSFAGMHAIVPGIHLRIYDADERPTWTGIVLESMEGRPLLPYARPSTWIEWFASRRRADFIDAPQAHAGKLTSPASA